MLDDPSPEHWLAPAWHPDFGDPRVELEHLRAVSLRLLELSPGTAVILEAPEPGLLNVRATVAGVTHVEIHSVPPAAGKEKRRYGVFISPQTSNEIEEYAESPDAAARLIVGHCCK